MTDDRIREIFESANALTFRAGNGWFAFKPIDGPLQFIADGFVVPDLRW